MKFILFTLASGIVIFAYAPIMCQIYYIIEIMMYSDILYKKSLESCINMGSVCRVRV